MRLEQEVKVLVSILKEKTNFQVLTQAVKVMQHLHQSGSGQEKPVLGVLLVRINLF